MRHDWPGRYMESFLLIDFAHSKRTDCICPVTVRCDIFSIAICRLNYIRVRNLSAIVISVCFRVLCWFPDFALRAMCLCSFGRNIIVSTLSCLQRAE